MADNEPTGGQPVVQSASDTSTQVQGAAVSSQSESGWNGELDHLGKQEWFTKLDEPTRALVEGGIKTKYTNLEGGYNKKFQGVAEERKGWTQKEAQLTAKLRDQEAEALLYKDIFGQGSPEAKDVEGKLAALRKEYEDKYGPVEKELTELRTFKQGVETEKKSAYQGLVEKEAARMGEAYKDIMEDDKAGEFFERLLKADFEEAEAADMTRSKFKLEAPRLPGAAANASRGDGPAMKETLPWQRVSSRDLIERAVEQAARQHGVR